jgi:hypothetical protein
VQISGRRSDKACATTSTAEQVFPILEREAVRRIRANPHPAHRIDQRVRHVARTSLRAFLRRVMMSGIVIVMVRRAHGRLIGR